MLSILATPDTSELQSGTYKLTIALQETDTLLKHRFVSGEIDWGDGSTDVIEKQAISLGEDATSEQTFQHVLSVGATDIKVRAQNYRSPVPDTALAVFYVQRVDPSLAKSPAPTLIIGPILPSDAGFPDATKWNFNVGKDLQTIESSLKLLLTTTKGERLMDPDFGTNLRSILFDPDTSVVETQVQTEISTAIERYASFVSIMSLNITRGDKQVKVEIRFVSNTTRQDFQVNLSFER